MTYSIISGEITPGVLYIITGDQSVTYDAVSYVTGQTFRGVFGILTFVYSGSGTQEVNEVLELAGGSIELVESGIDTSIARSDTTLLEGMAVEFALNDAEKIVNEVTKIQGFAVELIDYPFYSFEITETRL